MKYGPKLPLDNSRSFKRHLQYSVLQQQLKAEECHPIDIVYCNSEPEISFTMEHPVLLQEKPNFVSIVDLLENTQTYTNDEPLECFSTEECPEQGEEQGEEECPEECEEPGEEQSGAMPDPEPEPTEGPLVIEIPPPVSRPTLTRSRTVYDVLVQARRKAFADKILAHRLTSP